jgi:predicted PhzF superfamily epimerase YddE/YHI9
MPRLHVLDVFVGPGGAGGNPLGVFLEGFKVPPAERQAVAAKLGFSETVFVDDAPAGTVRIYTPAAELGFAGHPLVGTAWLLAAEAGAVDMLRPPAGDVPTWQEGSHRWIRGRPEWAPPLTLLRLEHPEAVDALRGPPPGTGILYAWAPVAGTAPTGGVASTTIRARMFAPALGIVEDEATGAAAIRLTATLGEPLEISQGRGSRLFTRPTPEGDVELGGLVRLREVREHAV